MQRISEETPMSALRPAPSRILVAAGLLIEIIGLAGTSLTIGVSQVLQDAGRGFPPALGTMAMVIGGFLLLYPIIQGRWWAFAGILALQTVLAVTGVPIVLKEMPQPGVVGFAQWLNLSLTGMGGTLLFCFALLGILETLGWMKTAGLRTRDGGLTWGGALLIGLVCAWSATAALAYAVAHGPASSSTFPDADHTWLLVARDLKFQPADFDVEVGRTTAVFVSNRDPVPHSFDIDALNVHVAVPPRSSVVAMVRPTISGRLPYYCAVPGHKGAGMAGILAANRIAAR